MVKSFIISVIVLLSSVYSLAQELPRGVYNNCLGQIVEDSKEGNLMLHRSTIALLKEYEIDYFADRKLRSLLDPASEIYNNRHERIVNRFYEELEEQNKDIQIGIVFDNLDVDDLRKTAEVYLPTKLKCKNLDVPKLEIAELNALMNPNEAEVGAQDLVLAEALKSFVRIFAPEYLNSQSGSVFKNSTSKAPVTKMIDFISVHHEYWKAEDEMQAFYAHLTLLTALNSIRCYLDLDIKIEVFNTLRTLEDKSKEDQADLIDPLVDRVLLNSSFKAVSAALDRYCNYVEAWGQNNTKTVLWPVFNASNQGLAEMDCYGKPSNKIMRSQGFANDLERSSLKKVESDYLYNYKLASMNGFTTNGAGESKCGSPAFPHWSPGDVKLSGFMWLDLADIAGREIPLGTWLEPEISQPEKELEKEEVEPEQEEIEIIKEEPRPAEELPTFVEEEVSTGTKEEKELKLKEAELVEEVPVPDFIEEAIAEEKQEELAEEQKVEALSIDFDKAEAEIAYQPNKKNIELSFPSAVPAVDVKIFNLEGRELMEGMALLKEGKGSFAVYGLKPGTYTAKITYADKSWESRIQVN